MDESALKTLLDSLENSRSSLDSRLDIWTFLVVLGVIIEVVFVVWEYVEKLRDFKRGEVHPPEKPSKVRFVLELIGAAFVAIGVAGELYVDAQIGTVETEIRSANDRRASLLSKEAGDAKNSALEAASAAFRANDEAGQAIAKSGEAEEKADFVSKETDALAIRIQELNTQIDAQGPRAVVIGKAGKDLLKKVSPFAGQEFTAEVCGPVFPHLARRFSPNMDREKGERMDTWTSITDLLYSGAKWKWTYGDDIWEECSGMWGTFVYVSLDAPPDTMKAAQVLSEELTRVLPPQDMPVFEPTRTEFGLPPIDEKAPWVRVSRNHGLIAVLVAEQPTPRSKNIAKPSTPNQAPR